MQKNKISKEEALSHYYQYYKYNRFTYNHVTYDSFAACCMAYEIKPICARRYAKRKHFLLRHALTSNIEALKQYVNMRLNSNGEPENLTRLDIRSENGKFTVDASGEGKVEKILYGDSETVPTAPGTYPVTCVVRFGDETLEFQIGTLIVPEPPAEAAQPAPVYHVTDKDGNQIPYTAAREGGVLTIRVDAAYARLTLTADEAQALTAQGVEKVVFITTGATSAFRPADLTAYKDEAPFVLTHDGETVTFTAGETDLASLLLQA